MNPLTDVIPARARKYVYALAALGSLVWGAYEAADGDWRTAPTRLVPALLGALAASNTHPEPERYEPHVIPETTLDYPYDGPDPDYEK